jgi:hypothetical protein
MTGRLVERFLWICAAAGLLSAVVSWRQSGRLARSLDAPLVVQPPPAAVRPIEASALGRAADAIARGNLFRPERRPPDPTATSLPQGVQAPPQFGPPKAQLILRGLLGGPPWEAVLEGVPGREGSVLVRAGQVINGLTIRAVSANVVVVQGMDTTWTLTMPRP